jgi:hypothetical protein
MAGSWTSERFPQFETAIRHLTDQHRELKDEPLHLAISYGPIRDQQDIFLFEVIGSTRESINPSVICSRSPSAPRRGSRWDRTNSSISS